MTRSLEELVDDYLAKHEAAVKAGHRRTLVLKKLGTDAERLTALEDLINAHGERTRAFVALRDARTKARR